MSRIVSKVQRVDLKRRSFQKFQYKNFANLYTPKIYRYYLKKKFTSLFALFTLVQSLRAEASLTSLSLYFKKKEKFLLKSLCTSSFINIFRPFTLSI